MATQFDEPQRSPLHDQLKEAGARFVELGGWELPESFGSPDAEYEALINTAGIVDLCHRGRFKLTGMDVVPALNKIIAADMTRLANNRERVTFILNERGGIIDEVAIFRSDKFCTVHCNSMTRERVKKCILASGEEQQDFDLADTSTSQGSLEVRGPHAEEIMRDAVFDGELPLDTGATAIVQIGQGRCLVTRTSFGSTPCFRIDTGGLFLETVWDRMMTIGGRRDLLPVGWRALEMARLEMGIPAVGYEIDESTTPIEIGATMKVEYSKRDFMGRKALLHSTCSEFTRRLVYLRFDGLETAAPGDIVELDGMPLGYITSSSTSPKLKRGVAFAILDAIKTDQNTPVVVRTSNDHLLAAMIARPAKAPEPVEAE